jgi:hypothetical protein
LLNLSLNLNLLFYRRGRPGTHLRVYRYKAAESMEQRAESKKRKEEYRSYRSYWTYNNL